MTSVPTSHSLGRVSIAIWVTLGLAAGAHGQTRETVAIRGHVVYLESFTSGKVALRPEDEPRDYRLVPLAEVERVLAVAQEPKKVWVVKAPDHRFSDNLKEFDRRLLEAIGWINQNAAR